MQYVDHWTASDGAGLTIRPIRPEDEPMMVAFHQSLSERSVYLRYFHMMNVGQRTTHERLKGICFIDYDREMALVAERPQAGAGLGREIVGVGRLTRKRGVNEAELAVLISDVFQRRGLGTELVRRLIDIARKEKVERLTADILAENRNMQRICESLGFRMQYEPDDGMVTAELRL